MLRATILVSSEAVGDPLEGACREEVIIAEINPWWTQLVDRFGIVLNSANDNC